MGVLHRALGVQHKVLGVLHRVPGVLHRVVLGVLHRVLGYYTAYCELRQSGSPRYCGDWGDQRDPQTEVSTQRPGRVFPFATVSAVRAVRAVRGTGPTGPSGRARGVGGRARLGLMAAAQSVEAHGPSSADPSPHPRRWTPSPRPQVLGDVQRMPRSARTKCIPRR